MILPKALNTATPISKYLAMFLFILLPIIGFFAGMNYQNQIDQYKQLSAQPLLTTKSFSNNAKRHQMRTPVSPTISIFQSNDPSALALNKLMVDLNLSSNADIVSSSDFWIGQDGSLIPLKGFSFDVGQDNVTLVPSGGVYTIAQLLPIEKVTQKYFQMVGYQIDLTNTLAGKSFTFSNYNRFGFTKGDMKCVIHITASQDPFGNFFCGTIDTKQYALQQPFYSLFNHKFESKNGVIVDKGLSNVSVDGIFAQGQIPGSAWIAKNINGNWQIIWSGQQGPSCSLLKQYQVPTSFFSCN